MSLDYLVTALVVILLPGTGVLYTLALGLSQGWRASALAAFGCTLGILPHLAAAVAGLAALLHASAVAFQALTYLGAAYLLYTAWSVWRDGGTLQLSGEHRRMLPGHIILKGVLLNILNPKLSLFFLAFLPQFVPPATGRPIAAMTELSLWFMALTFLVFLVYGACASAVRSQVVQRPAVLTWLRRGFALAFAGLGLKLAFSRL
ncbi:LysE family translocator [Labrys sp. ZIDIC5]|uniref:LysE family translocator n=1 Tax=Labrys sedimenti TaxID=3106036 RepID=UPI002ACACF72|nr:LysE family translocator [Labrys sp. ZIDIC5]MDZ5450822.1 LysE family translocator [Labrys sp. ZIDIC5]